MKIKRFSILFVLFFLVLFSITYWYFIENEPLSFGIGYDPNTNEVIVDLSNESLFPIFVDDVIIANEDDTLINGKDYMYRLNTKKIMVFSDEIHSSDLKDEIEFFEPFTTLYIQANDDYVSYSILIKAGNFKEINEVKMKMRILGFLPFQVSRDVDLDINEVK